MIIIYNQNLVISSFVELLEKAKDFLWSDLYEETSKFLGDDILVIDLGKLLTLIKELIYLEFNSSLYSRLDTIISINCFYAVLYSLFYFTTGSILSNIVEV